MVMVWPLRNDLLVVFYCFAIIIIIFALRVWFGLS